MLYKDREGVLCEIEELKPGFQGDGMYVPEVHPFHVKYQGGEHFLISGKRVAAEFTEVKAKKESVKNDS